MAVSSLRKQTIMRLLQLMVYSAAIAISFVARAQQIEQEPVPINMGDIMYGGHPIFQGYWHNLCGVVGLYGGTAACLQLTDVPSYYNVVAVAYMKSSEVSGIPTFNPNPSTGMTEQNFLQQVRLLNSQGRFVILALGGYNSKIALTIAQIQLLTNEIIRLVSTYGFNGLTIDLEGPGIIARSNQIVIPRALIAVRHRFAITRTYFSISASPDSVYLRNDRFYWVGKLAAGFQGYLSDLELYIDWISPQFLDYFTYQDLERSFSWGYDNLDLIVTSLLSGIQDFIKISQDKLVMGVPTNKDAAFKLDGYLWDEYYLPRTLRDLFNYDGDTIRGIMASSINWDLGVNFQGNPYNGAFANTYGPYLEELCLHSTYNYCLHSKFGHNLYDEFCPFCA